MKMLAENGYKKKIKGNLIYNIYRGKNMANFNNVPNMSDENKDFFKQAWRVFEAKWIKPLPLFEFDNFIKITFHCEHFEKFQKFVELFLISCDIDNDGNVSGQMICDDIHGSQGFRDIRYSFNNKISKFGNRNGYQWDKGICEDSAYEGKEYIIGKRFTTSIYRGSHNEGDFEYQSVDWDIFSKEEILKKYGTIEKHILTGREILEETC